MSREEISSDTRDHGKDTEGKVGSRNILGRHEEWYIDAPVPPPSSLVERENVSPEDGNN